MTTLTLALDDIQPYWRNPRRITQAAIDRVAHSIGKYGYRNKIIVDKGHVIITGHTRYAALRKLGWTEVEVEVAVDLDPDLAREYRLVDNSTHEESGWAEEKLLMELREIRDPDVLELHFPNVDLTAEFANFDPVTADDVADGQARAIAVRPPTEREPAVFICPHCLQSFQVDAADLDARRA